MKKLSFFVGILVLFLFCSCPPGVKPEEAKTYKITLKNGETEQDVYYKGTSWYSDSSCTDKIETVTPVANETYAITYDLKENETTTVEGCTPSEITEDLYTKATKFFKGYYYSDTKIVDETGRLLSLPNINSDIEAETKFETNSVSLPTDIQSATKSFKGWSLNADRSGEVLQSPYTPTANTTLYAIWEEQDNYNVYFEVEGKDEIKIKVGENEVSTSDSQSVNKNENFSFSISNDGTFDITSVEYKNVGGASYTTISSSGEKYTISSLSKNIIVKITVEVKSVTVSFGYSSTDKGENRYIAYKKTTDDIINGKVNVPLSESCSFKVESNHPWGANYYNVKVFLSDGSTSIELLPNEEGVYTIESSYLIQNASKTITIKSVYVDNAPIYVYNTNSSDVLKIRKIVGEQNGIMPLTWKENYLNGNVNKGEKFNFKVEFNDPSQYEVRELSISYMEDNTGYKDGTSYFDGPNSDGVYSIDVGSDWWAVNITVILNVLTVPLTYDDGIEVFDVSGENKLTMLPANKSTSITIKPTDSTKVISAVVVEYKSYDYTSQKYVQAEKTLSVLRNASDNNVYTISDDMTIDEVKLTATLVSKDISISKSGTSITWTPIEGSEFPLTIGRYSYLSFKVEPTESGKVIDKVEASYGDTTTAILPNENGIYTLTPDMTYADEIVLSATTTQPTKNITISFKSDGVDKATFKDSVGTDITESTNSKEKTEYEFIVEASGSNTEVESVFAIYNGKQIELKPTNGKYTLSKYITASNVEVVAKIRYINVTLTPDSSENYTFKSENDGKFASSLPYNSEYKFKVISSDNTKKITRIKVLSGNSKIPVDYIYEKNGVYTLPSDDVVDNISLVVDSANATGDNGIQVIEKDQTVSLSTQSGKIPYVLITNFSPSGTYASEELKYVSSSSWDKVRSNNIYPYSLLPNGASTQSFASPRAVSTISSPSVENGKVVWRNYVFNYTEGRTAKKTTKDFEEVYTDTSNKIIYLVSTKVNGSDKYSASDDSPIRALIDYMYSDPDSSVKMPSDLLVSLQNNIATPSETFPNKDYLFDKSATDRGYFFVLIDRFDDRGWSSSVGGYFSSSIYSGNTDNDPYAAFYLNSKSSFTGGKDIASEKLTNYYGVANNFVSTLSHEYTHYLESDYKHANRYENTSSLHFLSEGYANYNAAKGTKDTTFGGKLGIYMSELLAGHKIYDPKDSDDTSYGLGHLFFMYIEEKYGKDVPGKIMADDKAVFEAVKNNIGKEFGELYNDFVLNLVFSGYTDTVTINGATYGDMSFAKYTKWDSSVKPYGAYVEQHGFESVYSEVSKTVKGYKDNGTQDSYIKDYDTGEAIYNDVKMILDGSEGISSSIGEMSFRLVCYSSGVPSTLTLTSESPFIKAYLFYSDKTPQ